jgi:hypothetical protein
MMVSAGALPRMGAFSQAFEAARAAGQPAIVHFVRVYQAFEGIGTALVTPFSNRAE